MLSAYNSLFKSKINMPILPVNLVLILSFAFCSSLPRYGSDVGLNTVQITENYGYMWENHDIITEDGYILTYQRIPHGTTNGGTAKKPAVLLMHGLFSCSNYFVDTGPKYGLGYILADLGYDVWLANARGTSWSRRHKTLDISADQKRFFDFSWHEIGYYDLPAAIDHILNVTKLETLYYVGHSQGGTAFLVFASTRPEYAKKIKLASLVATSSFTQHAPQNVLYLLSQYIYEIEELTKMFQIYEFPFIKELQKFGSSLCVMNGFPLVCQLFVYYLFGERQVPPELREGLPVLLSHHPSHASLKQLFHYGQLIRNGGFSQYDHGLRKNQEIYGQNAPPSYDLSKITIPVAAFSSVGDMIVNYKDVKMMIQHLPNVVHEYLGPTTLGHTEFLLVKQVIDPTDGVLIKVLEKF